MINADLTWTVECDACHSLWEFVQPYFLGLSDLEYMLMRKGWTLSGLDTCPECNEEHDDTAA